MQAAKRTTAALKPGTKTKLDAQILEDIAGDAPSVELTKEQALQGIMDVIVVAGLQPTKSAARRCFTSVLMKVWLPCCACHAL